MESKVHNIYSSQIRIEVDVGFKEGNISPVFYVNVFIPSFSHRKGVGYTLITDSGDIVFCPIFLFSYII